MSGWCYVQQCLPYPSGGGQQTGRQSLLDDGHHGEHHQRVGEEEREAQAALHHHGEVDRAVTRRQVQCDYLTRLCRIGDDRLSGPSGANNSEKKHECYLRPHKRNATSLY